MGIPVQPSIAALVPCIDATLVLPLIKGRDPLGGGGKALAHTVTGHPMHSWVSSMRRCILTWPTAQSTLVALVAWVWRTLNGREAVPADPAFPEHPSAAPDEQLQ